ncbi:MAG: glycosyltransferase family 4 protein [Candidatus Bathyarchaeia archaeon]
MRVLVLAQYFPPDMGGGATRAYNVAKGLVANGCRVTVVAAFPHYPSGNIPAEYRWKPLSVENMDGFKVYRTFVPALASEGVLKRLLLFVSFAFSCLFALPFVGRVDVVWAANPNVISVFPGLVYSFVKNCPLVQNVDDLWPEVLYDLGMPRNSLFGILGEFLAKLAYRVSTAITPISPGYVGVICGKYGADRRKVHVVRAGVDLEKFKVDNSHANSDNKCFRVLYSGAFSLAYDFDQVLLAAKLLENIDDIEFVLQGGGEFAGYLKGRVKALGLKNVKIIDEIIGRDEVAKLLGEADALILPLRDFGKPYLGLSSKLYEYQAVGKPIICCAYGQPAEYVKETGSGIIVKPGDYEGLAEDVLYLEENRDVAGKMGVSGRRYVENNLSIAKIGSEIMMLLGKVIAD